MKWGKVHVLNTWLAAKAAARAAVKAGHGLAQYVLAHSYLTGRIRGDGNYMWGGEYRPTSREDFDIAEQLAHKALRQKYMASFMMLTELADLSKAAWFGTKEGSKKYGDKVAEWMAWQILAFEAEAGDLSHLWHLKSVRASSEWAMLEKRAFEQVVRLRAEGYDKFSTKKLDRMPK
jgi:hypothetical protein